MIGRMLGNRYEIIEKIGGGGMAVVYKAKCHLLNRYVAIKILRHEYIHDKDLVSKFKRESQAVASLSHPNIVNVYDVGEIDDLYYIVMELVSGKTLKKLIQEKGNLHQEEIIYFTKQIAMALQHAHENFVVHRDIKPQNILITEDHRAKVTDFGIALSASASTLTNTGSLVGSVHYFSPEQARGGYTDAKTDLYSLGIVMYEMATGKVPFEGESPITVALKHLQQDMELPSDVNPSISEGLEGIILKLTQKEQMARFQSAASLMDALSQLETDPTYILEDIDEEYDESPTQITPQTKGDEIRKMAAQKSNRRKKTGKTRFILVTGVLTALVAALLFTFGLFYLSSLFGTTDDSIKMPELEGLSLEEARIELEALNLQHRIEYRFDSEVAANTILAQNPTAGMSVRPNYPVELIVSTVEDAVEVPDVTYKTLDDARFALEDEGFVMAEPEYVFSDLPKGTVVRQDPRAGSAHEEGGTVHLIISEGPEVALIPMPNVEGNTLENAKGILESFNLRIGEVLEEFSNEYVENMVIGQSIPAGREVAENTAITLTVSKGVEEVQIEEPVLDLEDPEEANGAAPEAPTDPAAGESVRSRPMTIGPVGQSGIVEVRLYRLDDAQRTLIFSKTHNIDNEGDHLQVNVTGTGVQTYEIEIDGRVVHTTDVTF
ncbi:Stk1 family PASTA domain-containing Ser/Thr kinase [Anoxynatronum sibiricum]|uniref:non-specific serine/threonine protein kinase n=2 Tax=Anoxynatronum sibiricum TaxID=210623 RepID=A0ABU9VQR1_9CLOT